MSSEVGTVSRFSASLPYKPWTSGGPDRILMSRLTRRPQHQEFSNLFPSPVCCLVKVAACCACRWANHLPLNACTGVCPSDGKRMRAVCKSTLCIWLLFATAPTLPRCFIYYIEKYSLAREVLINHTLWCFIQYIINQDYIWG